MELFLLFNVVGSSKRLKLKMESLSVRVQDSPSGGRTLENLLKRSWDGTEERERERERCALVNGGEAKHN
jgi:hypothetical protein